MQTLFFKIYKIIFTIFFYIIHIFIVTPIGLIARYLFFYDFLGVKKHKNYKKYKR